MSGLNVGAEDLRVEEQTECLEPGPTLQVDLDGALDGLLVCDRAADFAGVRCPVCAGDAPRRLAGPAVAPIARATHVLDGEDEGEVGPSEHVVVSRDAVEPRERQRAVDGERRRSEVGDREAALHGGEATAAAREVAVAGTARDSDLERRSPVIGRVERRNEAAVGRQEVERVGAADGGEEVGIAAAAAAVGGDAPGDSRAVVAVGARDTAGRIHQRRRSGRDRLHACEREVRDDVERPVGVERERISHRERYILDEGLRRRLVIGRGVTAHEQAKREQAEEHGQPRCMQAVQQHPAKQADSHDGGDLDGAEGPRRSQQSGSSTMPWVGAQPVVGTRPATRAFCGKYTIFERLCRG